MATANDVNGQFMGGKEGSKAGNTGWTGLAPQPDNEGKRLSQFLILSGAKNVDVDRQSLVEAVGTLVFEATYRIKAETDTAAARKRAVDSARGETVLGHSAIAAGQGVVAVEKLDKILALLEKK